MRDYPPPDKYAAMLGNPQSVKIAFKDKLLGTAEIEKTAVGLPRARSGAFAVVYRANLPDGSSSAVRLFLKDGDDRQERYQAIFEHLSRHALRCLVPFTYFDNAFRAADAQWYPLMTMEWVKGETLYDWLGHRVTTGDQKAIRSVTEQWQRTIQELNRAQIAHGDLQHGNIMITPSGEVKLVDYDGMCVPKLVGRRNLETGVEPYQHPDRNGDTKLSLSLDNFSSVFIYVGLRALAVEPKLWDDFVVKPEYDKMLFRKEDFDDPRTSPLFQRLRRSPDADVQRLASTLHELSRVRMDQVPFLDDLLFSWDQVRLVLDQRDFDAALALVSRGGKQPKDAPGPLQPRLHDAQQRVAALADLTRAVAAGDEATMAAAVGSALLKDYPKAAETVAAAVDAPVVLGAITKLDAARKAGRGRDLVREWDAALPLLRKPKGGLRKSAAAFESDVESWRTRNRLCDQVLDAIKAVEPDAQVIASAWKELARLGGHPECDGEKGTVERLVERDKAWRKFMAAGSAVSEATDRAVVAAWNESLFAGWPKAQAERQRASQAQTRLKSAQAVTHAASAPLTVAGEEALVRLSAMIPPGYSPAMSARVDLARKRLAAMVSLSAAITADSDSKVAAAFRELQATQADALVDTTQRARIDVAVSRNAVLEKLKTIPPTYPNSQAAKWDDRLLAAWDARVLQACSEAATWASMVAKALRRQQLLADLDRSIAARDLFRASDIDADPLMTEYPHTDTVRRFLQDASGGVRAVRGMLNALNHDDRDSFRAIFSASVIREHSAAFKPSWSKLLEWTRAEILPFDHIGLGVAVGVRGVEVCKGSSPEFLRCTVRWKWPDSRFTDECRVLLCRNKPAANAFPDETASLLKIPKTRELYQSGGGFLTQQVSTAWKGSYVVVWAKIDLGATTLWSEPLVLGKV